MKKLIVLVAITVCGGWYLKSNLIAGPDSHVQSVAPSLSSLGVNQGTQMLAVVTGLLHGPATTTPTENRAIDMQPAVAPSHLDAQRHTVALGHVPSGQTSSSGQSSPSGRVPAASASVIPASVDLAHMPSELVRFVTPALLTTTPTGTQDLSASGQLALRLLVAQARANPAAFREQLAVAARTYSASR